ncbi:MAG: putative MATE family efflux protein [Parvicellaceae bacterium]|jgi:putative MATE family efflux protein
MSHSTELGTEPIGKLLFKQALPAAIGFMVMSLNTVVDSIYLGNFIGEDAIGAVTSVTTLVFLFGSVGMAIGMGGSSIVSRALGEDNMEKASWALNNQVSLMLIFIVAIVGIGYTFAEPMVYAFGGRGNIFPLALDYFKVVLVGIPFLAWGMMCNNNIRAEGRASMAMMILLIPSVINIILDDIFIRVMGGGIVSAGWATSIAFILSTVFTFYFYFSKQSELKFNLAKMRLKWKYVWEIVSIGSVSLIRQGSIAMLMIILSWSLFKYGDRDILISNGGEIAYNSYGVASRMAMFAFFPLIGITQGFMPIAGYNYGAKHYDRVRLVIKYAIISGTLIAAILCAILLLSSELIPRMFSMGEETIEHGSDAIFYVFMATPLVMLTLVGSGYYQAIGRPLPAMLLTLTKQTFFLIPAIFVLSSYYGLDGIWYSFPVADGLSALVCWYFLAKAAKFLRTSKSL